MSEDDRRDREEEQPPPPEWQGDHSSHQPTADGHPDGRRGRTEVGRDHSGRRGPGEEQGLDDHHRGGDQSAEQRQDDPPGVGDGSTSGVDRDPGGTDRTILQGALWVIVAFAVAGLVLGLLPSTYGSFGDEAVTEDRTEQEELTEEEREQQRAQFNNQVINLLEIMAPYLAVLLGQVVGLAVGVTASGSEREGVKVAALGTFVGVVLFMLLSTGIAVEQWQTVEESGAGFLTEDRSLDYGTLLVNGVSIAVPTALGATVAAYAGARLRSEAAAARESLS